MLFYTYTTNITQVYVDLYTSLDSFASTKLYWYYAKK